jgi:hypothetical protein
MINRFQYLLFNRNHDVPLHHSVLILAFFRNGTQLDLSIFLLLKQCLFSWGSPISYAIYSYKTMSSKSPMTSFLLSNPNANDLATFELCLLYFAKKCSQPTFCILFLHFGYYSNSSPPSSSIMSALFILSPNKRCKVFQWYSSQSTGRGVFMIQRQWGWNESWWNIVIMAIWSSWFDFSDTYGNESM